MAVDVDFVIPLKLDDLKHAEDNHYTVNDVFPPRELTYKLQESRSELNERGAAYVLKYFDVLYSVLCQFGKLKSSVQQEAWDIVFSGVAQHGSELCFLLDDSTELDSLVKTQHVQILKMSTYLLCQFTEHFEAEATKPSTDVFVNVGKSKRKQSTKKTILDSNGSLCNEKWDWSVHKDKFIHCLTQLCMLPLNKLFEPPIVEAEFVNLICNCCYKLLENPSIGRLKNTKDAIFNLVGIHVKKYSHSTSCSLKIIQLLRHFEHLVSTLAYGVNIFVNNYGAKTMINEIIREIARMDDNDLARDNSEARSYSQFLVEIAQQMPTIVLPSISLLLPHLNGDAYSMRNCVIEIMGEIVLKVLSDDNLDEKSRALRNEFLEKLEDHVHDVNAFVRCRAIQIWHKLCAEKVIPLHKQHRILSLIVGRLEDKSCNVRKNSIQALTTFVNSNPFAAKLPLIELENSLERETKKLEVMIADQPTPENPVIGRQPEKQWSLIEPKVTKVVEEIINEDDKQSQEFDLDDILLTEALGRIKLYLDQGKLRDGVRLLRSAMKVWTECTLFNDECSDNKATPSNRDMNDSLDTESDENSSDENDVSSLETESNEDSSDADVAKQMLVDALKRVYMNVNEETSLQEVVRGCDLQKIAEDVICGSKVSNDGDGNKEQEMTVGGIVINELNKQQVLVHYLKDCVSFAEQIHKSIPIVCQLLGSKTNSDVMEAVEFFVTAFEFGVQDAVFGIKKMLLLIWSKEPGVKESVVNAYKRLYLKVEGQNQRNKALTIVNNLILLMRELTLGELTSLEELICEFMKSKELSSHVIQVLWEKFSLKLPNTTDKESCAALVLLSMAAGAEVAIISSNVDVLVTMGLGNRALDNFLLVKDTCTALLKLAVPPKTQTADEPVRFSESHDIFIRLADILVEGVTNLKDVQWVPMAEQAVATIYKLAERADHICADIIRKLAKCVSSLSNKAFVMKEDFSSQEDENEKIEDKDIDDEPLLTSAQKPNDDESEACSQTNLTSGVLSRVLFIVGQIALHQLIHLELNIASELKRRHFLHDELMLANHAKDKKKSNRFSARPSLSVTTPKNKEKTETVEEEMGLTGAIADDAEAEYLRKICDAEIVTGCNLLSLIAPLIIHICSNPSKYKCVDLRASSTLALAKFMLVSSDFCERYLPLLFTILEKSEEPLIRANTIIALGDLSFRFPNLIEPWTPHLYSRLRDESIHVRKNTLLVLTHLILNDMVKVKGQISDVAICIIDVDSRISGLAKLFFSELSQKGNAVYNILPDIISRLSDSDSCVDETNFKAIQEYLFSFIQKDRQVECLTEKLCHRFQATRNERQWRDIAFCLSLLSFGDKSIKKLQENFGCFSDKLGESFVYDCFVSIVSSAKKSAKFDTKVLIEELEQRIEEAHEKGVNENQLLEKASQAKSATQMPSESKKLNESTHKANLMRSVTKSSSSNRRKKLLTSEESQQDFSDADDFMPKSVGKKNKSLRRVPNKKVKKNGSSSSDDGDRDFEDYDEIENVKPPPRVQRFSKTPKANSTNRDISKTDGFDETFKTSSVRRSTRKIRPSNKSK